MAEYSALAIVHIASGAVGLVSGALALSFRKGGRLHRAAGNVFFISMLSMASLGGYLANFIPEMATVVAGMLTFYMVATAWMTVMRNERQTGLFEIAALLFAVAVAVTGFSYGFEAASTETGTKDGFPAGIYYAFGGVAALAAGLDLSVILRRGVSGRQRIARHLWRMCYALFMAAASFFLGQAQVIPEPIRILPLLAAPVLLTLALMFFWLFRVLFTGWWKNT